MPAKYYCPRCLNSFDEDLEACANLGCKAPRPNRGWARLFEPGDLFDRHYVVCEVLAMGGAGVTYRARPVDAEGQARPIDLAIKVLHSTRRSLLRRLATEAQVMRALKHPTIVDCLGFVEREDTPPYLITRFEKGGTLAQYVAKGGPLPPFTAAGVLHQIFEALSLAHAKKIVHRDLKPANILLREAVPKTEVPRVRVADWGIAKVASGVASGMTRVSAFIGTPQYAAPEQLLGEPATAAADIYAAGGIAWFLLTARPPLEVTPDMDLAEVLELQHRSIPPKLPAYLLRSRKARMLGELVEGTMREPPDERWSVRFTLDWLDHVLGKRPDPPKRKREASSHPPLPSRPAPGPANTRMFGERPRPAAHHHPKQGSSAAEPDPRASNPPAARPQRVDLPGVAQPGEPAPITPESIRKKHASQGPRRSPTILPERRPPPSPPREATAKAPDRERYTLLEPDTSSLELEDIFGAPPRSTASDQLDQEEFEPPEAGEFTVRVTGEPAWLPNDPAPLPDRLPAAADNLLRLLGVVAPSDRRRVVQALLHVKGEAFAKAVRDYRGGDRAWGRGLALAIEHLRRRDLEPIARSLLADRDPGVRVAAMMALVEVGLAIDLQTLAGMIDDEDERVRVIAVRAVAALGRLRRKHSLARYLLEPHLDRPDPMVRDAIETVIVDLEHG